MATLISISVFQVVKRFTTVFQLVFQLGIGKPNSNVYLTCLLHREAIEVISLPG